MRRVLLVEDHQVVRDGLKSILREQLMVTEFDEASTAAEALSLARDHQWDLAVVDISLAGTSGLDLLRDIKLIHANLPVLVLSMHSEEQYARRAYKAGAAGYITKDSTRAELASAMAKVIAGRRYVSPTFAERLLLDLDGDPNRPLHQVLSDREFEVLRLIGSGKTVGEAADILSLSDKTVSTYRARILEKMRLNTTAELIRYVIENKLLD
jgi:two-component system invasion response regulator UvrY